MTSRLWICLALGAVAAHPAWGQWPQWGGPDRNFQAEPAPLAEEWPEGRPKEVWRRPLGEGTSSIAVVDGTLYTLYRQVEQGLEAVVALDAASGATIWEQSYPAPLWPQFQAQPSRGPHTTPLVVGDRLYTVGVRGYLACWDRKSGERSWEKDLWKEYGATPRVSGHSSSPLVYQDKLIVQVGGKGSAVVALDLKDGQQIWSSQDFTVSYASPLLIQVDGQDQVVLFLARQAVGIDPADGRTLWQHPHKNVHGVNASTPLWAPGNLLFLSSGYDGGSRVLRLKRDPQSGATAVEELWVSRRIKIHHGNAVWLEGRIYASSGDLGPAFLVAVDPLTGKMALRQRGFTKSNFLVSGSTLIILDQDGELALARPQESRIQILQQCQVLKTLSWTVPTLVGTRLYLRDRKEILALELGK